MANIYRIKQLVPAGDDWYCVTNPEEDRWFIERVVLWALVEGDEVVDHVRAIGDQGMPVEDEEAYFVRGSDPSPKTGHTWHEMYLKTIPERIFVREITEWMRSPQP